MKKQLSRILDKVLVKLLALLGVASCLSSCMYGCPDGGDFILDGTVTNHTTKEPIKGIRVIYDYRQNPDTLYTDDNGYYKTSSLFIPQAIDIKLEDIDGIENGGEFETVEKRFDLTEKDQIEPGDGNWYQGHYEKTINIALTPKEATKE